jgi:uncharacterized protein involved in oxidation of intracellular sulfur
MAVPAWRRYAVGVDCILLGDAVGCGGVRQGGAEDAGGGLQPGADAQGLHVASDSCGACGTCLEARRITDAELLEGVHRSSKEELTAWTSAADKVLVF